MMLKEEKPYTQAVNNNIIIRTFEKNVSPDELKWHRDSHDRTIEVLKGTNWFYQLDDSIPIKMQEGMIFKINKDVWHRVIGGDSDLVVRIIEG
jgi:quercetin dioxygenase-like cupin family protein